MSITLNAMQKYLFFEDSVFKVLESYFPFFSTFNVMNCKPTFYNLSLLEM